MAVTPNIPLQKYVSFKGEIQYKANKLLIHKTLRDNCASNIWLKFNKNSSSLLTGQFQGHKIQMAC